MLLGQSQASKYSNDFTPTPTNPLLQ